MLLWLSLAPLAWADELVLEPLQVHNGELAMLRWEGETPSFGVVRFNDRVIDLYPDDSGAVALLPVGLDTPSGHYPVLCAVVDRWGNTVAEELNLEVVQKDRPLERLTLPEKMVSPKAPEVLERIARERAELAELFAGRSPRMWAGFQRPVADPVNSIFGKRRLLNGKPKSPHSGTDFRSPAGTPVRSMANGWVVLVADLFYTGNTVVVDHGQGLYSLYAHLSKTMVSVGEELVEGATLGTVGSTGRSTGPHLHLTMKLLGERIDPMAVLSLLAREDD